MTIHVSAKHKAIGVPVRPDLANLFPSAKQVTLEGKPMLVVRHGTDETKLLRNMGFDVPTPILAHYDWEGGTPFDIQRKTAAMLTMNKRAYVLNGMGTGKTKASLWSWRYLNLRGEAGKLLVVAPLSTLNFTWAREIFQTLPGVKVQVLHGTKQKRLQRLADPEADVYIINHDGLAVIADELARRSDIDTCILDELAVYRNGTATRTKVTRKVIVGMKWAWGMTGSPTPNQPTDAWAQCSLLTPTTVPKYFNRFRDEVMYKITQFKWAPKQGALDKVFEVMQPAVRFTLDDVMELPDLVERTIDIEMGPKQAKVYKQMEEHAHALIAGHEITAMNAGVVLNKLLQISLGFIYSKDKQVVTLDNDERLNAIVDIVNATDRKVIVFAPFVHSLEGIAKRLTSEGYDVRTISGNTPKSDRDQAFNLFQNTSAVKVLVAHPQTMAHGLTLTAADTIVWAAPITSLEIFLQANARIRRIGQKHKQQIIMLQATKVEKKAYERLRKKEQVMNLLLDMFAESTQ
jgi:SNF2 family DNA or RNA helicase